jgi:catechol 2,3-dioxygenase-like lactoylglutathione lyase family enzyme/GNAT superfamily N-acetyltransferase
MLGPPPAKAPPRDGLTVVHAQRPSVAYYRYLYDAVGREYDWTTRKRMSDAALSSILGDPRDEIHVLLVDGSPAGFAELDRRIQGEVELVQFGLMPEFIGQGLGKWFLHWTMDKAWSYAPTRFWLHTCTKDHPAALPNYLQAGFEVYKEETKEQRSPKIETLVETAIYVDDLDATERFYRDVLNLHVIGREAGHHVFFQSGDTNVLLAFAPDATLKGDKLPSHGARGPGHFALGIKRRELDDWRRHIQKHGIAIEKEVQWPAGGKSLYFRDPAGNAVELVTPGIWGLPGGW